LQPEIVLFMRGSPARTYEARHARVPPPEHRLQSLVLQWLRLAATRHSMPSSMRRPMFKSVLKSNFERRRESAFETVFKHAFCSWVTAALLVGAPIMAVPDDGLAAESAHCLTGDEQRAAIANGKTVPLATVIHTLHRAPKDVIKAQLCQEPERLIYVLTLLGRDGKVKRALVDATNGAVVGER
jgi:hypothetical protein